MTGFWFAEFGQVIWGAQLEPLDEESKSLKLVHKSQVTAKADLNTENHASQSIKQTFSHVLPMFCNAKKRLE